MSALERRRTEPLFKIQADQLLDFSPDFTNSKRVRESKALRRHYQSGVHATIASHRLVERAFSLMRMTRCNLTGVRL